MDARVISEQRSKRREPISLCCPSTPQVPQVSCSLDTLWGPRASSYYRDDSVIPFPLTIYNLSYLPIEGHVKIKPTLHKYIVTVCFLCTLSNASGGTSGAELPALGSVHGRAVMRLGGMGRSTFPGPHLQGQTVRRIRRGRQKVSHPHRYPAGHGLCVPGWPAG